MSNFFTQATKGARPELIDGQHVRTFNCDGCGARNVRQLSETREAYWVCECGHDNSVPGGPTDRWFSPVMREIHRARADETK